MSKAAHDLTKALQGKSNLLGKEQKHDLKQSAKSSARQQRRKRMMHTRSHAKRANTTVTSSIHQHARVAGTSNRHPIDDGARGSSPEIDLFKN